MMMSFGFKLPNKTVVTSKATLLYEQCRFFSKTSVSIAKLVERQEHMASKIREGTLATRVNQRIAVRP